MENLTKKCNSYFSWLEKRKIVISFFIFDFLSLLVSFLITNLIFQENIINLSEVILLSIIWGSFSYVFGRYTIPNTINISKHSDTKNYQYLINIMIFLISYYFISHGIYFEKQSSFFLIGKLTFAVISIIIFSLSLKIQKRKEIKKKNNTRFWGFYGSKENFSNFLMILKKYQQEDNYYFKYVTNNDFLPLKYRGIILYHHVDNIELKDIINNDLNKNINVYFLSDWLEENLNKIPFEFLNLESFYKTFNRIKNNRIQFRLKRYGDITLSIFLLLFTSPILIIAGFLIWLSDKGSVIYIQKRVGKNGKEFNIYKLRTMIISAEQDGPKWVSKKDKRITFIGKLLRKTRIDEIPQLICVLNGDMSLIGPRPERPEIEIKLKSEIANYDLRHLVKPGLSGWAQVNANYAASIDSVKLKHSYDLYYILNQSLWIDLLILLKTIKVVFTGKGSEPIE